MQRGTGFQFPSTRCWPRSFRRVILEQVDVVMQPPVFGTPQGILDDQLTDKTQIAQLHDFPRRPSGLPHHVDFVVKQVESALCPLETLV